MNEDKFKSDADLVKFVHTEMKAAMNASGDWRSDAEEDYAFYSGEQWSAEDVQKLRDQNRPAVVFNRAARTINAVAGLEVQNRQEVRYVPRETNDNSLAEYYSAVVKWARDQTDAEDEDSEAFQDTLISGMGWTQTRLDYDIDQEGMIEVSRFDALEAFWDPNSRKRNLADRKWCARVKRYGSAEEVRNTWPDYTGSDNAESQSGQYVKDSHKPLEGDPPFYDGSNKPSTDKDPIEVICFNWYELESVYRVVDPQGQSIFLTEAKFEKLKDFVEASGLQYVKQKKRHYRLAYVAGSQLLDMSDSPVQTGFIYNCITGLRNRNNNSWFGLMRLMIDPQKWANKWLSQIMHILNSNSKGGLLAEKDAFENPSKAEKDWANPEAITLLRPGALSGGKIQQKQMAEVPAGFHMLMQQAIDAISDTPGVNAELMGVVSREQPGILEMTRKQAGITMLGMFFDSLRRYRKEQGRVMADLCRDYISDGRKIRIIGAQGKPEVVALMKDKMAFTYDIVVDDAPNSPSMKDKTFSVMQALLPNFAKMGFPIPPDVLDYLPLPTGVIEKWKGMMEKGPQQQAQEQDAQMLMREEKVAQIKKDNADSEYKQAQAAKTMSEIANPPNQGDPGAGLEYQKHVDDMTVDARKHSDEMTFEQRKHMDEMAFKYYELNKRLAAEKELAEMQARMKPREAA